MVVVMLARLEPRCLIVCVLGVPGCPRSLRVYPLLGGALVVVL
jgi:hypothetical protein